VRLAATSILFAFAACAKQATSGALGETPSPASPSRITAVDTTRPPRHLTLQLDQPGSVVVMLVAPGPRATLLYPPDSAADNRLSAGEHVVPFQIPEMLVQTDSQRIAAMARARDSGFSARRTRPRGMAPLMPTTPTYLLLVTSPRPLDYARIREKTAGVSIPLDDMEALNAMAKAVKGTIMAEPREWAGYYRLVEIRPP
jgi:hypothetical protein